MSEFLDSGPFKAAAVSAGFTTAGICAVEPPAGLDFYKQWIAEGNQAGMEYLPNSVELRSDPRRLLESAQTVIALTLNYRQPTAEAADFRVAQYARGRDYHKVIRGKMNRLIARWEQEFPGAEFRGCIDSAPIFEREYAHLAGLGWFGKNTCLIDSKRGSFFFIAIILTSLEVQLDLPALGGCGTCRACIEACPTGAIQFGNGRWFINSNRCVSYLTIEHRGDIAPELAKGVGDWSFGCDVCQDVCPFNAPGPRQPDRGQVSTEPDFAAREYPSLVQLATMSREDWDERFAGSAIRRAGFEGLIRNVKLNLKNRSEVS